MDDSITKEIAEIYAELVHAHARMGIALGPDHPAILQAGKVMERLHQMLERMRRDG